jgi:biotin-(acetyl-CoA carboxylase) ligase
VAGILVETHENSVVVGVGVNCRVPEEAFPAEFRDRAGSLDTLAGWDGAREDVLAAVARRLLGFIIGAEVTLPGAVLRWNELNAHRRQRVRVSGPLGVVEGDGLFLDARQLHFHVFTPRGFTVMPLSSTVEAL